MRQTTLLSLFLAGAFSLALFSLKYKVQDLDNSLKQLNQSIVAERRALHVLKAEWSLLNDPARLRPLAEQHLGLGPVSPAQVGTFASLQAPAVVGSSADGAGETLRLSSLPASARRIGR